MNKDFIINRAFSAVQSGDFAANRFWMAVARAAKALTITDVSVEQGNPCYDPDLANNGGGYDQPYYTAVVNGVKLVVNDSSCGDYGTRFFVEVGDDFAQFGSMETDMEGSGLGFESLALLWLAGDAGALRTFSNSRWEWLVAEAWREYRRAEFRRHRNTARARRHCHYRRRPRWNA